MPCKRNQPKGRQAMNPTESMHRRPTRKADEVDAFSALHTAHRYRPGQSSRSAIKDRYTRRERRATRQALRSRI